MARCNTGTMPPNKSKCSLECNIHLSLQHNRPNQQGLPYANNISLKLRLYTNNNNNKHLICNNSNYPSNNKHFNPNKFIHNNNSFLSKSKWFKWATRDERKNNNQIITSI